MIEIKGWGRHGVAEARRANALIERAACQRPYEGQTHGVNTQGVGLIEAQTCHNAVQNLDAVLSALGFASLEEMLDAVNP